MNNTKYIGMDVHRESISIAVMNSVGKIVLEYMYELRVYPRFCAVRGPLEWYADWGGTASPCTP